MKAVIVRKPFDMAVEDVAKPSVQNDNEVLIKVISGGICGSDIGIYTGTNALATYPRLIGHEYAGKVVEMGSKVDSLKIGDIVAVDPVRSCGHCYACTHGRHNVCGTLEVTGVHRDGGFAEYVVAPASACYPVGNIPAEYACLVEPFSIGVQVNHRGEIGADDTVLVMGSGPIGLCVMQVAKARGAKVMMTDILPERLERALRCGADRAVNAREEDVAQASKDFSGGEGVTVAVDTVCSVESFPQAVDLVCPAGRVVTLGLRNQPSQLAQVAITKKEVTVLGSRLSNYRFPEVIELLQAGAIHPEMLCTGVYPIERATEAFDLIRNSPEKVCKICLRFDA